jgi:hypothetical protein
MLHKLMDTQDPDNNLGPFLLSVVISIVVAALIVLLTH